MYPKLVCPTTKINYLNENHKFNNEDTGSVLENYLFDFHSEMLMISM